MAKLRSVPDTPPRAVAYLRQSVAREESISLELQETACRDYAVRSGYQVVDVVADPGISGRTWKRPGVQRVLAMVEAGEVDVVLLWKWSRLSRSRRDWAIAADRVEVAGGRIESATESVDVATSVGRLARGVLTEFAAFESERIGEQWKEVHERRRKLGLPAQGGDRFGYRRNGDLYVADEITGPVLARMFAAFVAGDGFSRIAADLNRQGVRTLHGGVWARDRVTKVLDSGFGAGQIVTGRGANATWVAGAQPPVVDEQLWAQYVVARERRRGVATTSSAPKYPLSGLLRCGDCGSPMHAARMGRVSGYGFVCARWAATNEGRCVSVSRAKAERVVLDWLAMLASDVDAVAAREHARAAAQIVATSDAQVLARRIVALDEQLNRLTGGWSQGLVPDAAYRATRDEVAVARAALVVDLAAVEGDIAARGQPVAPVARTLLGEWDVLPVAKRRQLLGDLLSAVVVVRPPRRGGSVQVRVIER